MPRTGAALLLFGLTVVAGRAQLPQFKPGLNFFSKEQDV
jgi:hypothetical protein